MHGWTWAEVAPAAPLIEAVPPLLILAGLFVALGLVVVLDGFVRGLLNTLAGLAVHIPLIGGTITGTIHSCERAISDALGTAIAGIQNNIAHQFHNLARVIDHFWHSLERMAHLLVAISKDISGVALWNDLKHLFRALENKITHTSTQLSKALEKRVHALVKELDGLGHHVIPRLRAMEHAIDHTIPREIKTARDLAKEAEDGVVRLWKRVKALESNLTVAGITALVATALAALGLDWLGCKDGASRAGRSGCALWNDVGAVLGFSFLALEVVDLRQLVETAQGIEEEVTKAIQDVLSV